METHMPKSGFSIQFRRLLKCLLKKIEYLEKSVASENKSLLSSMLQQLLGKKSCPAAVTRGTEWQAKEFSVFFGKKKTNCTCINFTTPNE